MLLVAAAGYALATSAVAHVTLLRIGVQLSATQLGGEWRDVAFATVTQLVVAPALAWATAAVMGLDGLVRQTSILQASLPAAIWASEFGVVPGLVSSIVAVTTLVNPVTITVLLALLR